MLINLFIKMYKTKEHTRYIVLILKEQKCYLKLVVQSLSYVQLLATPGFPAFRYLPEFPQIYVH